MRNPIQSFDIIKNNYIRYIETAFGTRFEKLEEERRDLLNTDKVLYREPWIEPLFDYQSSEKKYKRYKGSVKFALKKDTVSRIFIRKWEPPV